MKRVLFAAFAILIAVQIFVPPFVGMANNGDFPRVTGLLSIGPLNGWVDNFGFFDSRFIHSSRYFWNSGIYSSELPLAWTGTRFSLDIRAVGAVHATLLLTAFWLALKRLPLTAAIFAIFIFTDLSYTAYLNSFYSDEAALLGLLLMVVLADENPVWFALAALLFVLSKSQHGVFGLLLAAWLAYRSRWLLAALVFVASVICPLTTPRTQVDQNLYDVIFGKVARTAGDFVELGLSPDDVKFIGTNVFTADAPGSNPVWLEGFAAQSSYGRVLVFYANHPGRALDILRKDLTEVAWPIRPGNISTRRREDIGRSGLRYSFWTDFRSRLFKVWPWHIVLWYTAVIWVALRKRSAMVLGLCILAIGEFCLASLMDAAETGRHLFLFHAITDVTFCIAAAQTSFVQYREVLRKQPYSIMV